MHKKESIFFTFLDFSMRSAISIKTDNFFLQRCDNSESPCSDLHIKLCFRLLNSPEQRSHAASLLVHEVSAENVIQEKSLSKIVKKNVCSGDSCNS